MRRIHVRVLAPITNSHRVWVELRRGPITLRRMVSSYQLARTPNLLAHLLDQHEARVGARRRRRRSWGG